VAVVDEVSPEEYGEDRIVLALVPEQSPRQFEPVTITVDYEACLPADVVLPLEMTVTSESGAATFQRQVFLNLKPDELAFIPREGGQHLVRLFERFHNRWFGAVQFAVAGEKAVQ
jgi:hypothetical protein